MFIYCTMQNCQIARKGRSNLANVPMRQADFRAIKNLFPAVSAREEIDNGWDRGAMRSDRLVHPCVFHAVRRTEMSRQRDVKPGSRLRPVTVAQLVIDR